MLNKLYIILILSVLSGCAATKQEPLIVTKEVQIPVRVKCTTATPIVPKWAVDMVKKGSDIYTQMQALIADRVLSKAYEAELVAALESCKK